MHRPGGIGVYSQAWGEQKHVNSGRGGARETHIRMLGERGAPGVAEGEILYEGPQQGAGSIPSGFAVVLVSQSAVEISPYDDEPLCSVAGVQV